MSLQKTKKSPTHPTQDCGAQAKPNYGLILIGVALALILVAANLFWGRLLPHSLQALAIATSLVLLLYGLYPVPVMRGTFGKLSVVGPAALGLFLFLFVWRSMSEVSERGRFILLQNVANADLNSAKLPDGTKVSLVEVDSLSAEKLTFILDALRQAISRAYSGQAEEADKQFDAFYADLMRSLHVGGHLKAALEILHVYKSGGADVDQQWSALVKKVSEDHKVPDDYIRRIKRDPFALLKIEENGKSRVVLVVPGSPLVVRGHEFPVPVIANPSTTVTKGIYEAVVIQTY